MFCYRTHLLLLYYLTERRGHPEGAKALQKEVKAVHCCPRWSPHMQSVVQHRCRLSRATATVNCLQKCYLAPLGRKGQSMSTLPARWLKAKLCRVCKRRLPTAESDPTWQKARTEGRRQLPSAEPYHFSRHGNTAPCPRQHLPY